jgi:hypothetical protein
VVSSPCLKRGQAKQQVHRQSWGSPK